MKTECTAYYAQGTYCDKCNEFVFDVTTTIDGDFVCVDCKEQHTCHICGDVSLENELRVYDGRLVMLCVDCNHMVIKERAATGDYDLTPVHDLMHDAINKLNRLI